MSNTSTLTTLVIDVGDFGASVEGAIFTARLERRPALVDGVFQAKPEVRAVSDADGRAILRLCPSEWLQVPNQPGPVAYTLLLTLGERTIWTQSGVLIPERAEGETLTVSELLALPPLEALPTPAHFNAGTLQGRTAAQLLDEALSDARADAAPQFVALDTRLDALEANPGTGNSGSSGGTGAGGVTPEQLSAAVAVEATARQTADNLLRTDVTAHGVALTAHGAALATHETALTAHNVALDALDDAFDLQSSVVSSHTQELAEHSQTLGGLVSAVANARDALTLQGRPATDFVLKESLQEFEGDIQFGDADTKAALTIKRGTEPTSFVTLRSEGSAQIGGDLTVTGNLNAPNFAAPAGPRGPAGAAGRDGRDAVRVLTRAGRWNHVYPHGFYSAGGQSTSIPAGQSVAFPLFLPTVTRIDALGVRFSANTNTSPLRLAIYANTPLNEPGALLLDAGTINVTSATWVSRALAAPFDLDPAAGAGGVLWASMSFEGATGTNAVLVSLTNVFPLSATTLSDALLQATAGFSAPIASGSAPNPFPSALTLLPAIPRLWYRTA